MDIRDLNLEMEKLDWTHRILVWVRNYWKIIVGVAVAFIVSIITFIVAMKYIEGQREKAAQAFYEAYKLENKEERIQKLQSIFENFSNYNIALVSEFAKAAQLYDMKKYDEALSSLDGLQLKASEPFLKVAALFFSADIYVEKGMLEDAAKSFKRAFEIEGNLLKNESRYYEARVLERLNRQDEALAIYEDLMDKLGEDDRELKNLCEERLIWLAINKK